MKYVFGPAVFVALSGCAAIQDTALVDPPADGDAAVTAAVVAAPPPPPSARTVEQFDTTTPEQREAATSVSAGGAALGQTVASLGDPSQPGFWAETPLVDATTMGRLVLPGTGASVAVELRPISGDAGAGSRVSLAALRALGVSLTDLPTLDVFAN